MQVKCDEAQPTCLRCKGSKRVCGGYGVAPRGSFSWNHLLRVRPSTIPSCSSSSISTELRGLDYFRGVVAPALASPLGSGFWTRVVLQLAIEEPATRHAVLAISSFYERFDPFAFSPRPSGDGVGLRHYNLALGQVATSKYLGADTVVLISVLFTCIEFLRGDVAAAIHHCRYGIHILKSMDHAPPDVAPIFHHLSIFPYFFGATLSDFPSPRTPRHVSSDTNTIARAAETLDCLMSRSVRLVRAFDPFRLSAGDDGVEIPPSLIKTQGKLCRNLDSWRMKFSTLKSQVDPNIESRSFLRNLEMRWLVCSIWVRIASCPDEMGSDACRDQFEHIVELAREDAASRMLSKSGTPSVFKFEMGSSPLLHFVVIKCRFLRLRLEALALLRTLACARESLWDAALMYGIGRCIIEREHGIEIPVWQVEQGSDCAYLDEPPPCDARRIRDSYLEDEMQLHVDHDGSKMTRRRIVLFVPSHVSRRIVTVRDWIYLPEKGPQL